MQLSRSLFAVIAMSSLLSIPAKAAVDVDWKLVGAGAVALGAAYLQKRQVNNNSDVLSQGLNAGSKVVQGATKLVQDNVVPLAVGGVAAFVAYHNKNIHHSSALHTLWHHLTASHHHTGSN